MRNTESSFKRIWAAVALCRQDTAAALAAFSKLSGEIREQAKQYKDEEAYINSNLSGIKEKLREKIARYHGKMSDALRIERETLEQILYSAMSVPPLPSFRDTFRFYYDFGLVPNKLEAKALLDAAGGNALAIRALNSYFQKSGAGFRIEATSYEEFAEDLQRIAEMENALWTGTEHHAEAAQILKGAQISDFGISGYSNGETWDATALLIQTQAFEAAGKALRDAENRWKEEVEPRLVEDMSGSEKEKEEPPKFKLEENGQDLKTKALELARDAAQGGKMAAEVREKYGM